MSEPVDFIVPMLREMRAENIALHDKTRSDIARLDKRIEKIEGSLVSFRLAQTADTLMSKLITGEFEERIELLEAKVRQLETAK
jgi:HPt (histidine-containing phosphotransfer) domain-containing protein